MRLHLIFARARNGVIGRQGTLPWHLPEDLAHFKATTMGCPVIMGRKTWDSLPPRFRPLPGRRNIVLSRASFPGISGLEPASSLHEALQFFKHSDDVWIIGGAELYAQTLPLAHSAEVTEIDADFDGDAFAPQFGPEWAKAAGPALVAANGLTYSFNTYRNTHIATGV
jgi:dihydrofolate reductase